MRPKHARAPWRRIRVTGFLIAFATPPLVAAQPAALPDPANPAQPAPALHYRSVLPEGTQADIDAPRLPWRALFAPGGHFVPESDLVTGSAQAAATGAPPVDAGAPLTSVPVASAGSDARGIVKALYPERGKIKLKHGPISRLDMPGMTMVFAVRDPAMLDGLKEGDEIGFSVEMQGTAFVITGFQK